jgi:23S rRNA (guanosine2251-2'-O)-methyltransferase
MKPPHQNRSGNRDNSGGNRHGGGGGHLHGQPHRGAEPSHPGRDGRPQNAPRPQEARPAGGPQQAPRREGDRPILTGHPNQRPREQRQVEHRPKGPEAPGRTVWLYGLHAVVAALSNPARRLRRLMLTEEAEAAIAPRLTQPWPIPPERVDRARLDQLLGRDTAHQGAALLADPLAPPSLAQALERPGPILVLDQVTDPRNIGAMLRTAAAFGVSAMLMQDRNSPEETGALAKAASGALEKVPLFRAVNIARTLVALKAAGCWVVGLAAGAPRLSGTAIGQRRVALVLGSEGEGLRRLTRDTCDEVAGIAMPKGRESGMANLNVSVAAAIALYELARPA